MTTAQKVFSKTLTLYSMSSPTFRGTLNLYRNVVKELHFSEYILQFGIILFPLWAYQLSIFQKSFIQLPARTIVLGLYGGIVAILDQIMPVHILGIVENFQSIPIIMSILYGKRKAGILSIVILTVYECCSQNLQIIPLSCLAILVYSFLPLLLCTRFETLSRRARLLFGFMMCGVTLGVELIFIFTLFVETFKQDWAAELMHYLKFLCIASILQLLMMSIAIYIMESIIADGAVRAALVDREQRYQSLLDYNPNGICAFDTNHRYIMVNSAYETLTGYTSSELIGEPRLSLWNEENLEMVKSIMDQVLAGEVVENREALIYHKQGHQLIVRVSIVPIVIEDKIVGYYSIVTDFTEAKAAEEMTRNSEKLAVIGELAAGVAHEIRNPLTALKGFVQLIPRASEEGRVRYTEIMKDELSRIEGIVSEMLVLAKPQAVQFTPTQINEKISEVVNLLAPQANMYSVDIQFHPDNSNPLLLAEPNQLKQVFINVGKNAIEAMPDGGCLTIAVTNNEDEVIITFRDEGSGLTEDAFGRLGQPFYTTKQTGTGLGLLVSKRILDNHHGHLAMESNPLQGTTVSISLPLWTSDANGRFAQDTTQEVSPSTTTTSLQSVP